MWLKQRFLRLGYPGRVSDIEKPVYSPQPCTPHLHSKPLYLSHGPSCKNPEGGSGSRSEQGRPGSFHLGAGAPATCHCQVKVWVFSGSGLSAGCALHIWGSWEIRADDHPRVVLLEQGLSGVPSQGVSSLLAEWSQLLYFSLGGIQAAPWPSRRFFERLRTRQGTLPN